MGKVDWSGIPIQFFIGGEYSSICISLSTGGEGGGGGLPDGGVSLSLSILDRMGGITGGQLIMLLIWIYSNPHT